MCLIYRKNLSENDLVRDAMRIRSDSRVYHACEPTGVYSYASMLACVRVTSEAACVNAVSVRVAARARARRAGWQNRITSALWELNSRH